MWVIDFSGVPLPVDPLSSLSVLHRRCCAPCSDHEHQQEAHLCSGPTMASLWSLLEQGVFNPQKERLLETVRVWKTGRRKKMSILCLVGENPGGTGQRV